MHSKDVSSKIQKHIFFEAYVKFLSPEVRARTSWSTRNYKLETAYHNDALTQIQIEIRIEK